MKNKLLTIFLLSAFTVVASAATDTLMLTPDIDLLAYVAEHNVCLLDGNIYQDNEVAISATGTAWLCESAGDTFIWHRHTQSY